jgi:hypothetical protein
LATKLTKEKITEYLKILNQYKGYFGMTDYNITLSDRLLRGDGMYLARVEPDRYEKRLSVELCDAFMRKNNVEQKKILVHELVHARVAIYQEEAEKLTQDVEEFMVNDITAGVFKIEDDLKR